MSVVVTAVGRGVGTVEEWGQREERGPERRRMGLRSMCRDGARHGVQFPRVWPGIEGLLLLLKRYLELSNVLWWLAGRSCGREDLWIRRRMRRGMQRSKGVSKGAERSRR